MKKEQKILLAVSFACALAVMVVGILMIFSQPTETTPLVTVSTGENSTETTYFNGEMCEPTETLAITQPETTVETKPGQNGNTETKPVEEETEPSEAETQPEAGDQQEQVTPPPTQLPPEVEILPEEDPVTGEPEGAVKFPCTVPGYDLVLEKIAPYNGPFVETGTNEQVQGVAMIQVKNNSVYPIEYVQLAVEYGETQLVFAISALPAGEQLVVQEQNAQKIPQGEVTKVAALVVQMAEMEMSAQQIRVTDVGENRLKIENLTDQDISSVRVFYKYYMQEEKLFVGGIAFTVRVFRLGANSSTIIQPAHYSSATGRVVMVRTYE